MSGLPVACLHLDVCSICDIFERSLPDNTTEIEKYFTDRVKYKNLTSSCQDIKKNSSVEGNPIMKAPFMNDDDGLELSFIHFKYFLSDC
jgi:hypothetical protein